MNNLAGAIGDLLGSNQRDDEDEDINTPLKPSKHGSRRTKTRSGRSSTTCLTISLIAFAAAFILCLIFLATSTISEGAWFSHWGFGDTSAVRTNRHIQNHDWKRTAGADRMDTSGLEKKIQHLERELQAANRGRRAAQPRAAAPHKTKKVDPWGHEDYVDEVEKKEKAEEDSINRKLSKEDKDSLHLDTEGLDKKHRNLLRAEKKAIDMQNAYARKAAAKDYSRRQKEIDEIMPSDIDCPGPNCLTAGQQKLSPRKYKLIHKHPPWHKKYPSEFDNVLKPSDWVKVSGRSDYARQKAEVDSMFAPEAKTDGKGEAKSS